jgi:thiamine phosphate synthase YjbQ (UPF0047 family)
METFETRRSYTTKEALDFVDITDDVKEAVVGQGIEEGRVTLFAPSPGCALLANERETGLLRDIKRAVERLGAEGSARDSLHIGGSSIVIPIVAGVLRLGMWQRLLLVELEAAGERSVLISIVGR